MLPRRHSKSRSQSQSERHRQRDFPRRPKRHPKQALLRGTPKEVMACVAALPNTKVSWIEVIPKVMLGVIKIAMPEVIRKFSLLKLMP